MVVANKANTQKSTEFLYNNTSETMSFTVTPKKMKYFRYKVNEICMGHLYQKLQNMGERIPRNS